MIGRHRAAPLERRERASPAATEKLQKVLADLGLGSRREIERWIEAGRVAVNGEIARLGARVSRDDRIDVDGVEQRGASGPAGDARVIVMNKAEGIICTRRDPEGRPTCFDALPRLASGRWVAVGRLDINSSGLLLFTNDGALAHALMHPSSGLTREYAVRVDRELDAGAVAALTDGVLLPDGELARFAVLEHAGGGGRNHWYRVELTEGRNREVRGLFESQGIRVSRLKRVRYGPIALPASIKRGRYDAMSAHDVAALYAHVGLPMPRPSSEGRARGRTREGRGSRKGPSVRGAASARRSERDDAVLDRGRGEAQARVGGNRRGARARRPHDRDARGRGR